MMSQKLSSVSGPYQASNGRTCCLGAEITRASPCRVLRLFASVTVSMRVRNAVCRRRTAKSIDFKPDQHKTPLQRVCSEVSFVTVHVYIFRSCSAYIFITNDPHINMQMKLYINYIYVMNNGYHVKQKFFVKQNDNNNSLISTNLSVSNNIFVRPQTGNKECTSKLNYCVIERCWLQVASSVTLK